MDAALAVALGFAAMVGVSAGTYNEFDFNASPSVFPPIDGPIEAPTQAQGYVQNADTLFLRQLSPGEQAVWDSLSAQQRTRAAAFIRNGGTLVSSLGSDF